MIKSNLLHNEDLETYRKCVMFYFAISTDNPLLSYDMTEIEAITPHKIFTDLVPVIREKDIFNLDDSKKTVVSFLENNIYYTDKDKMFLKEFTAGYYHPDILFDDNDVLSRIINHPMALWKVSNFRQNFER